MLATTVNRNIHSKMSYSTSNPNAKTNTLLATAKPRENINYVKNLYYPQALSNRFDFCLIVNNVHNDNSTITLDIELNFWFLNYLKSY